MNHKVPESIEQKIAERFEQGNRSSQQETENHVLQMYTKIQHELISVPLPEFNAKQLSAQMKDEMNKGWCWRVYGYVPPLWNHQATSIKYSFVVFTVLLVAYWIAISSSTMVADIRFQSTTNYKQEEASWWFKQWLKHGQLIRVPSSHEAIIKLEDRSIIHCKPNTILAFYDDGRRHIELSHGSITVHANRNPEKPMIVETPLGTVNVVGTTFIVEIIKY